MHVAESSRLIAEGAGAVTMSCDDAGTSGVQRFVIFAGAGKRRDWPPEVRASIVAESYSGAESVWLWPVGTGLPHRSCSLGAGRCGSGWRTGAWCYRWLRRRRFVRPRGDRAGAFKRSGCYGQAPTPADFQGASSICRAVYLCRRVLSRLLSMCRLAARRALDGTASSTSQPRSRADMVPPRPSLNAMAAPRAGSGL